MSRWATRAGWCATGVALVVAAGVHAAPPVQRGIALGLFSADAEARYGPYLDEIVAQGASHVSLVTVWYQHDIRSSTLAPRPGYTVSEANLRRTIAAAHARGLRVMLFPIVGIESRARNEWRGKIQPARWDDWFDSYQSYILRMARIAAEHHVAILGVGSELLTTEPMRERWIALIRSAREIFKGQILYSANWDHFEPVTFWDQVDLLGVTGYYELTQQDDPDLPTLTAAWRRWQAPLLAHARRVGKPLVFTEIGYPSLDGANRYPWDETRQARRDADEQALCYRAFIEAWDDEPLLQGVYFWNWFGPGGSQDKDYTPRGKPAARVLQQWYAIQAPAPQLHEDTGQAAGLLPPGSGQP
ncbi:MAG: hypothetical protein ABIJ09_25465 [Pseudomonadota bacterium]